MSAGLAVCAEVPRVDCWMTSAMSGKPNRVIDDLVAATLPESGVGQGRLLSPLPPVAS